MSPARTLSTTWPKLLGSEWQVPAFEIVEFAPKRTDWCICVFVLNEGERIRAQLAKMTPFARMVDIVVADGGSTDGSLEESYLRRKAVRTLLVKRGAGRLSAQMRMAFSYALTEGYGGVVVVDGNNKDDVAAIPRFLEALKAGNDHIQGSRFVPGGRAINTPWERLIAVRLIHAPLISWSAGYRYTDTTNGFRGYSARLLRDPRIAIFRDVFAGYELHYYLAIKAARFGYRVIEIPVTRTYPKNGRAPTKISLITGNWQILKTLVKAVTNRYDP